MEYDATLIAAASESQAMDWSLVLTSQAIDCTIRFFPEEHRWYLEIHPQDIDRALAALQAYCAENRGWAWRRELPWPGILFHWGALGWCVVMIGFHAIEPLIHIPLRLAGVMNSAKVLTGEWWRPFTAITLHADVDHLMMNVAFGLVLLGLLMGRMGAGLALWGAYLAGVVGNLIGLAIYPLPHQSLGASGMVMGALGLLALQPPPPGYNPLLARKYRITGLMGGILLFVLLGLSPDSDQVAHFGGFVAGLCLGWFLSFLHLPVPRRAWLPWLAVLLLSAWVIATWMLALHRATLTGAVN